VDDQIVRYRDDASGISLADVVAAAEDGEAVREGPLDAIAALVRSYEQL
jgi:hypothetical protein